MADKIKDAQDRMLESMFQSEPIADDEFSRRIVARIRRRLWLRRLSMPVAIVLGLALSFQPAMGLLQGLAGLVEALPTQAISVPLGWVPDLQNLVLAGMLFATAILGLKMLEE
jgi:hypothetical protein